MILALCAWALIGCTNPYETRYEPNPDMQAETVLPPLSPTQFRIGTDTVLDSIDMRDKGFILLGRSWFNSHGREVMENQARAAGAAEVILYTRHDLYDNGGPAQIGVGIGVGIGNIHLRNGAARHDRAFPDPAPGYAYMATYWARTQGVQTGGKK